MGVIICVCLLLTYPAAKTQSLMYRGIVSIIQTSLQADVQVTSTFDTLHAAQARQRLLCTSCVCVSRCVCTVRGKREGLVTQGATNVSAESGYGEHEGQKTSEQKKK